MHGEALEKSRPFKYDYIDNVPHSTVAMVLSTGELQSPIFVSEIICSGSAYAEFMLYFNGLQIATKRSGPDRNVEFIFRVPLFVRDGELLEIKATHYRSDQLAKFECGMFAAIDIITG